MAVALTHLLGTPADAAGREPKARRPGVARRISLLSLSVEAGDKCVELGKSSLDEMSLASPTLAPDALFIRTQTRLYRIGG